MTEMAERLIAEEEGRDPCAYRDSRGYLTIGIGCLVDKSQIGAGLCDAAITAQFAHDSATARTEATRFPHFDELSDVRKAVLISMCFQMGTKPRHWPNFMAAMAAKDYAQAAAAGRDSDWWRVQTHNRAERQMKMLESNEWVERS